MSYSMQCNAMVGSTADVPLKVPSKFEVQTLLVRENCDLRHRSTLVIKIKYNRVQVIYSTGCVQVYILDDVWY